MKDKERFIALEYWFLTVWVAIGLGGAILRALPSFVSG